MRLYFSPRGGLRATFGNGLLRWRVGKNGIKPYFYKRIIK